MPKAIVQEHFLNNLFSLLDETLMKDTYRRIEKMFHDSKVWNEHSIGGAMAIIVHTAYHLGEIRQALCTLK